MVEIPVIDISPLTRGSGDQDAVAHAIDAACREHGFFSVVGHGIDPRHSADIQALAREFFSFDDDEKAAISMEHGGRAWRGWFPLGGELTSGVADRKEGIYFGEELGPDDARVRAGRPLHGANLFPARPAALRDAVLAWLDACTLLGRQLMSAIAVGLGLDAQWFQRELTTDPVVLLRIFHYPPVGEVSAPGGFGEWGVAEHTDYGLLTILLQDDTGGLEVRGPNGWIEVPPRADALVCNLGDMLERMTGGRYRSTPHRVQPPRDRSRISVPFFFDPGWDVEVRALPLGVDASPDAGDRWDGVSVAEFEGTYGNYLLAKVSKVFPVLRDDVFGLAPSVEDRDTAASETLPGAAP